MVRTYSRRSMLATAFLPVVAPSFEPAPVADDIPPAVAYTENGLPRALAFFGPGPKPTAQRGWRVLPAEGGKGWFVLIDMRPPEQLDALDRFMNGDRDPETWELTLKATEWRR